MKKICHLLLIAGLIYFVSTDNLAQGTNSKNNEMIEDSLINRKAYGTIGVGVKYLIASSDQMYKNEISSLAEMIGFGIFLSKDQANSIGLEIKHYKYGTSNLGKYDDVYFSTIYYKYCLRFYQKFWFTPQININYLSNNPTLFLSVALDLGIEYKTDDYNIFIKNNFNSSLNISSVQKLPFLLISGISIKF